MTSEFLIDVSRTVEHPVGNMGPMDKLKVVMHLPDLSVETLTAAARYIAANPNEIYGQTWQAGKGAAFYVDSYPETETSVIFDAPGIARMSELTFWRMVADIVPNAEEITALFIESLCGDETPHGSGVELTFIDQFQTVGGASQMALLDEYCLDIENTGRFQHEIVWKQFIRYLRTCDMDHEVHQDEYITKLLGTKGTLLANGVDESMLLELFMDLIAFRLSSGQAYDKSPEFLYEHLGGSRGFNLKDLFDHCNKSGIGLIRPVGICASLYGSHDAAIKEALEYYQAGAASGPEKSRRFVYSEPGPMYSMEQRRGDLLIERNTPHVKGTGLHDYSNENKCWLLRDLGR